MPAVPRSKAEDRERLMILFVSVHMEGCARCDLFLPRLIDVLLEVVSLQIFTGPAQLLSEQHKIRFET